MGLLDDAIREHLELKRLRGTDPGEVARAEQDALGPVRREDESEPDEHAESRAEGSLSTDGSFLLESKPVPNVGAATIGHASQETVEINMEAELERGIDLETGSDFSSDTHVAAIEHSAYMDVDGEELTERKASSDDSGEGVEVTTSKDDVESRPTRSPTSGQHSEGTMDESQGFALDAPERKRSWFKRRPHRSFDE
jgi:hypothetical protein